MKRASNIAEYALYFLGWLVAAILGALGLLTLLAPFTPARAAQLSDEQAAVIYAAAYGQYGGALPDRAPTVHLVPASRLHALSGCAHCAVRALHRDGEVYLDESLDFSRPLDASILLHEFVHYLQYRALGAAANCEEWLDRERQAYAIQAQVLVKAGHDPRPAVFAFRQLIVARPCAQPEAIAQ